jgi:hypothetical protein
MSAPSAADQCTRTRVLQAGLRQLRRDGDRFGTSDTIHTLRNAIGTVQGALGLVEARLTQGHADEIELLLDLADTRLREGRALIARTQHVRFPGLQPARRAAA